VQSPTIKQELRFFLILERALLRGTDTFFDIETQKSYDPEDLLHRTMKNQKPTVQEAAISEILTNLHLRYTTQWILQVNNRNHVFDFLVEPNMVIECTFTDRTPSAVISWLQSRALVLDNKFKSLKKFVNHETFSLMFLESTRLHPTKLKAAICDLEYTDKLVTSIDEFELFIHEWKNSWVSPESKPLQTLSPKEEVELWDVKDPQSTLERFI